MAKALGPLAHGQAQFECRWHPRYKATSTFELRRRDNNVDQALRVPKKKMQREGVFRENEAPPPLRGSLAGSGAVSWPARCRLPHAGGCRMLATANSAKDRSVT